MPNPENPLNGLTPYYSGSAIYIPLPRESWASAGKCNCDHCGGKEGFWDTLVVPMNSACSTYSWTCHFPDLQKGQLPDWLSKKR